MYLTETRQEFLMSTTSVSPLRQRMIEDMSLRVPEVLQDSVKQGNLREDGIGYRLLAEYKCSH